MHQVMHAAAAKVAAPKAASGSTQLLINSVPPGAPLPHANSQKPCPYINSQADIRRHEPTAANTCLRITSLLRMAPTRDPPIEEDSLRGCLVGPCT
ncbi:unnamed protein product [Vitrella brassicaformis CCMP3155]|uniref:Uncharacterized protein n=1 Tax=Vitrella brassicaformis (strain CCMP3155) TaxID=1169540 RepID=A0A0G4FST6_VITBC|nr:unnamed protein product [Vitrella brassicaformis CCMP3155]|eukprot:CEM17506.1 unnamed protein product [Vitrella brassicaformis CCMP3155]